MTASQLYGQTDDYIVTFGDFKYLLIAEYCVDKTNRCKIYITSFSDDMDIIDTTPYFTKTETAIAHIEKELKRVANGILKSIEEKNERKV